MRSVATELCIERLSDTQLRAAARLFREYDTHRRGSLDFTGFASLLVAIIRRGASSRSPPPRRGSADRSAAARRAAAEAAAKAAAAAAEAAARGVDIEVLRESFEKAAQLFPESLFK